MSLLGYHGFNNWENHFMEDENEEIKRINDQDIIQTIQSVLVEKGA